MTIFDFATVAVSLILGLAVSYLLESLIGVFRMRGRCRMDWVPFVWAACVIVHQFQFWWALYELNTMKSLSIGLFSLMLVLAALLFLAGALVLPSGESEFPNDLGEYFSIDGSWGVGALAIFNFTAIATNVFLFGETVLSATNLLNLTLAFMALLVAFTRTRSIQVWLTGAYVIVLIFAEKVATRVVYVDTSG